MTLEQEAAVKNRGGSLLVSAAAGSGKTFVLVERLLSYVTDPENPRNIDEFLVITYTRAAAAQLRGRIMDALSDRLAQDPETGICSGRQRWSTAPRSPPSTASAPLSCANARPCWTFVPTSGSWTRRRA
jgi:ATP-dependent exoDNAse (exonuclease V) beta subunit